MRHLFTITAALLAFAPSAASAFVLDIAVGAKGGMNSSVVREVPEGDPYTIDGVQYHDAQGPDFYAMFGLGGGVGGTLELRALGIVGIETGLYMSWDNGDGWEDKNTDGGQQIGRIEQEQRTKALHIPLMLKASVPGFIRPTFGFGLEILKQTDSELTYRSGTFDVSSLNNRHSIEPSTYTVLAFSFGVEIDLGPVRVPIELRGGYNVGFDKSLESRIEASGNSGLPSFAYDGKYEGHLALYTGVVYSYDLLL